MRYSLEPSYRKYIEEYGFVSFARNFGNKYGKSMISSGNVKKLMDTATKTGKEFAETAGKEVVHKSAEATGDLVGSKIADRFIKLKSKKEKDDDNVMEETQELMIPPEKRKQITKDLKLF